MSKLRIKPELLSLLTQKSSEPFASSELCVDYLSLPTVYGLTKTQVKQFIFRNMRRLEDAGLVVKERRNGEQGVSFKLTSLFTNSHYTVGSPHCKNKLTNVTDDLNLAAKLHEKLSRYKLELISTIAEVEEYENLSKQIPSIHSSIQSLYNEARDRCSKLLGKVKATESLIAKIQVS